jgi:hypothetical protein
LPVMTGSMPGGGMVRRDEITDQAWKTLQPLLPRVPAETRRERDAGVLELVERPALCRGQASESHVERTGLEARLCRGQRALPTSRGVDGQCDSVLQEPGRGGQAPARLRPARRALQLGGHSVWSTPTYELPSGNIRRCGLPI